MNQQQYYSNSGGYSSGASRRHHGSHARHGPQQRQDDIDIYAEGPYDSYNDPDLIDHRSRPRHSSSRGHHTSQQQSHGYEHRHEWSDDDTATRMSDSGQRIPEDHQLTNGERALEPRYSPERRSPDIYPDPNDGPDYMALQPHHPSTHHGRNHRHEASFSDVPRPTPLGPPLSYEEYNSNYYRSLRASQRDSTHHQGMGEHGHRSEHPPPMREPSIYASHDTWRRFHNENRRREGRDQYPVSD